MISRWHRPYEERDSSYQRVLYIEVACARWVGYAISVTSNGADDAANVRPNPIKKLCHGITTKKKGNCIVSFYRSQEKPHRNAPSADEHPKRVWGRLENSCPNHNERTNENGRPSSESIGYIWREGIGRQRSDALCSVRGWINFPACMNALEWHWTNPTE